MVDNDQQLLTTSRGRNTAWRPTSERLQRNDRNHPEMNRKCGEMRTGSRTVRPCEGRDDCAAAWRVPTTPPSPCLPATLTGSSPAPPWEWAGEVGHYQAGCVRRRLAANVTNTNESPWAIFAFSRTNLSLKCKKSCIWTSGIIFAAFYFTLDDGQKKRMNAKKTDG